MDKERFEQQRQFILELDKEKGIQRQTHVLNGLRPETDAEHAWHAAAMCYLLHEYANEEIDVLRTMTMLIFHDVVEIDAGDSYAYDPEAQATAHEREQAAAERLYALLPEDQAKELKALWEEFEANETADARFAHAMDNLNPMLVCSSHPDNDWKRNGVHRSQTQKRADQMRLGSEFLADRAEEILDHQVELGEILPG